MKRASLDNPDYRKGFDNPHLSDCTIILVIKDKDDEPNKKPEFDNPKDEATRKLHVSKLLLAIHSNYFSSLFTRQPTNEIFIDVESTKEMDYFFDVIRCIYQIDITSPPHELFEVLQIATQYEVECAIQKCSLLLKTEFTVPKACRVLELAAKYPDTMTDLVEKATAFLVKTFGNLTNAVQKEEFLSLSFNGLCLVLDNEKNLIFDSENTILYAVILWMGDKAERKQHSDALLNYIRFPQLRSSYLLSVPYLFKDYPTDAFKQVNKLFNSAMEFKVGGLEWVKGRFPPETLKIYQPRPNLPALSTPFEVTHKFTNVLDWVVDQIHWSPIFFSNGYNIHFYLSKSKSYPVPSFGIFVHVYNKFIDGEDFRLPLTCTIYLANQNGNLDKIKPFTTTFRSKSKGLTLEISEDNIVNGSMTVKLEVIF